MKAPPLIMKCREAVKKSGYYMMIVGLPGTGKTFLLRTVPNPGRSLIVDFEGGLRSVSDCDIDAAPLTSSADFDRLLDEIESGSLVGQYDLLFVDSFTALADLVLSEQPDDPKLFKQKYGVLMSKILDYSSRFRHMPINVVATAGINRNIDTGLYEILTPGQQLPGKLGFLPDFVGATRVKEKADGSVEYGIQFAPRAPFEFCKSRDPHHALGPFEKPNLAEIFQKLTDAETKAIKLRGAA